jgi:hypothetical protein
MLHGAIIYPGKPDDAFITSLHLMRQVKWEVVLPTLNESISDLPEEIIPSLCNIVAILDSDFTSFRFLSGLVRKGCHLFLTEKQKMSSYERVKLIHLAEEGNTFIQIRNDLLFHPSVSTAGIKSKESKLIEIHHIVPGKADVLQESLYSNLLMILKIVDSAPSRVSVCSIPNGADHPDVVNIHLNFHNGSAASLTLSFNGEKKEHLLSVHSSKGVLSYNFKEENHLPSEIYSAAESKQLFGDDLLFRQIAIFSDCILRRSFCKFGLSEEAKTFQLIEKINKKLDLCLV